MSEYDKLLDFFSNHGISPVKETGRSFIFHCPACGGKEKLYIQKDDGLSVCFKQKTDKCPKAGSQVPYVLHLLSGLPMDTVKREYLDFAVNLADDIRVNFDDAEKKPEEVLEEGQFPLDIMFMDDRNAVDGLNYLEKRGISSDVQKKYLIGYLPSMRRVVFPVVMSGKLYGWQGRAIDPVDKNFRMHNMPGNWRFKTLMFYDNIKNKDFAILAEGPISALKFEKVGNFVASMGKEVGIRQLELLKKSGIKKLYLALDRDAVDKLMPIYYYMSNRMIEGYKVECYQVDIPENRDDFGDCTFEECEEAIKNARPIDGDEIGTYLEFKLSSYEKKKI